MKKRIRNTFLAAALAPCLISTSVSAAPSVDELEGSKAQAESEAAALQEELTALLTQINDLEEQLIENGEKLIQTEADLSAAEEKAQEQYEDMKTRIKYMYEGGQTDMLSMLLTAEDFSDFLNKAEYASMIHTYDRQKLQELQETQEEIKTLKTSLEEEQEALTEAQDEYAREEANVNAQLEAKRSEVENFDVLLQAAAEAVAEESSQNNGGQAGGGNISDDSAPEGTDADDTSGETSGGGSSGGNSGNTSSGGATNSGTDSGGSSSGSSSSGGTSGGGNSSGGTTGGSSSGSTSGGSGTASGNTATAQAIVNAAYSQLGVKYVYGGTTPGVGLDCSGLVQYAHRVAGISLPRTSGAQGASGIAVSNPQPGDIVCYVGHVGIYIGNGQMIHAPKPGDVVRIASVYGNPWYRRCW